MKDMEIRLVMPESLRLVERQPAELLTGVQISPLALYSTF